VLNALREVESALIAHSKAKELIDIQRRRVTALEGYLHLAHLQYNNGQTDYLQVLDAERHLFAAQLDLASAIANGVLTHIDVYKAIGGCWVVAAEEEVDNGHSGPSGHCGHYGQEELNQLVH
jgi:multidrug efflux system outer membrane protein